MHEVAGEDDLRAWADTYGFPCVLKADGTDSGGGVAVVHSLTEAQAALRSLRLRSRPARALKRLVVNRDAFPLLPSLTARPADVTAQGYVNGHPANIAVACWQGEVLASLAVDVLQTQGRTGAATVVRVVDSAPMLDAARALVRRLGSSGLVGFDFMIEESSATPFLIEMNPRATQLCHLPLGAGRDLLSALAGCVAGRRMGPIPGRVSDEVVAIYPQAWHVDPTNPLLRTAYHDVPWEQPDLVRELGRPPWPTRGPLGRLEQALRLRRQPATLGFRGLAKGAPL